MAATPTAPERDTAIRPFRVDVPEDAIVELRRRLAATRWPEKAYPNLIYFHEVAKGGHFAAWEQPRLFSEEVRAAFRSLR